MSIKSNSAITIRNKAILRNICLAGEQVKRPHCDAFGTELKYDRRGYSAPCGGCPGGD